MADQTINAETTTTSMAATDKFLIWRTANGDTRAITKQNALGFIASGDVIALANYTLTLEANSILKGTVRGNISGDGHTLTVAATGIAALLDTIQTFTATKAFTAVTQLVGGVRSGTITLASDTATSLTPPIANAMFAIWSQSNSKHVVAGIVSFNTASSAGITKLAGGANFAVTTGVLAGTTGSNAFVTVAAHTDGKVYVENRGSTSTTFGYMFWT